MYFTDSGGLKESLSEIPGKVKSLNTELAYLLFFRYLRLNALSSNPDIFSFIALIKSLEIATH